MEEPATGAATAATTTGAAPVSGPVSEPPSDPASGSLPGSPSGPRPDRAASEALVMDAAALSAFLAREFPQWAGDFTLGEVTSERLVLRLNVTERHLRPGRTVSGPALFALVDVAVYLAVLARIGPRRLAVTTSAALDFLRRPPAGHDLRAECRLLKLGRRLAVGEALVFSDGTEGPVARASLTYSIPPSGV